MSKKLRVSKAYSLCNGIAFYSRRNKGYVAKVTLVDGKVVTKYEKEKYEKEKKEEISSKKPHSFDVTDILTVVFLVLILRLTYFPKFNEWQKFSFLLCAFYVYRLIRFVFTLAQKLKTEKYQLRCKYHSAEHMAVNAMNKLHRVPNLEEIKKFSRFCVWCGTSLNRLKDISCLWVSLCIFFSHNIFTLILGGFLILLLYLLGALNFFQLLTTLPPTDKELGVAIASLQLWFNHETES